MKRGLGAALSVALLAASLVPPARAMEIRPQDEYVAACAFLGGMGGGVLGAALGGLSRPAGGSRVTPFMRWAPVGALFGGVLGYEIGASAVEVSKAAGNVPSPAVRETTACVGALAGELIGFGLGALVARPAGHVSRSTREMWAGISLGAVVGAAGGFLLPPVRILVPPPPRSVGDARALKEETTIEPILPPGAEGQALMESANTRNLPANPRVPNPPPSAAREIAGHLLATESERLSGKIEPLHNEPAPLILPDLVPPAQLVTMARATMVVGLLEGAAIGMSAAGALNGDAKGFLARLAGGGALGALGGMSAAAGLSRSWTDPRHLGEIGVEEGLAEGRRTSVVMAGGLLGTLLGAATGALLHNVSASVDRGDISLCALGGNAAGLLVGALLTSRQSGSRP